MPLYLYLLLGSLSIPLIYTIFVNDFIKYWRLFTTSTIIIAIVFLIWDYFFTKAGIWGFNYFYCLNFKVLEMPLEEWAFFIVIPFCSLFIHYAFLYVLPTVRLPRKWVILITMLIIISSIILVLMNFSKSYTAVNFTVLAVVLIIGLLNHKSLLEQFYITFLIILIPFAVVNGVLTGAITEDPVVWYSELENLGVRLYSIPIEDIGYCFSLLFGNMMIFEALKKRKLKSIGQPILPIKDEP